MGLVCIPFHAGRLYRTREHRLAVGEARQRYRVEGAEGMKRVALDAGPGGRRVDELEIEVRVVPDQDRLVTGVRLIASRTGLNIFGNACFSSTARRKG